MEGRFTSQRQTAVAPRPVRISVTKRGGTVEPFDFCKLRACLLRVLPAAQSRFVRAGALAAAVRCYLIRRGRRHVGSAAILEMALTALRAMGQADAAKRLERGHLARTIMRSRLTMTNAAGRRVSWSKEWLARQVRARWGLRRTTARIFAGQIEQGFIRHRRQRVRRAAVIEMLSRTVAGYGLARPARAAKNRLSWPILLELAPPQARMS